MKTFAKLAAGLGLAAALFASPSLASDETRLLAHASDTVDDLRHSPNFGNARRAMRHARAVLIVPALVKGGFIFGAEGGSGVLLARTRFGHEGQFCEAARGDDYFGVQAYTRIRLDEKGYEERNSDFVITGNNIYGNGPSGNSEGLRVDGGTYSGYLDARNNYWGSASGPGGDGVGGGENVEYW